ncbi:MAG: 30S ribosomal protein S20 [Bdellovibrionota bacterium]
MANHKSAAKRARQTPKRTAVNSRRKSTVRTHEKSLIAALTSGNAADLKTLFNSYMSQMAKAAKTGVFKKQTASRHISRLAARVHAATAPTK